MIFIALAMVTLSAFAQKNELKTAEKALKVEDYSTAMSAISAAESLIANMDDRTKAKFYFLKAKTYYGTKDFQTSARILNDLLKLEETIGKKKYTIQANTIKNQIVQDVYSEASEQYNSQKYKPASSNFYLLYTMRPTDTIFAYNAAVSAYLAKDYDASLKYHKELQDLKYTGISTIYYATSKESGEKVDMGSKSDRDLQLKIGLYENPVDETTDSKAGDIIKRIASMLSSQGKTDEALATLEEAREIYPNDVNLILDQANIYYKLEQMDKFGESMELAINLDPSNPTLFFNLGVISYQQGKVEEAKENYRKAIELKEDYGDAYLNLAIAIRHNENDIVDELNKTSDFDKYDELLLKIKDLRKSALPYLEKADKYSRSLNTVQVLMNVYETLEMEEKAKEYTELYRELKDQ